MKCENISCIYQEYDECTLGDIKVDVHGEVEFNGAFKLDGMCNRILALKLNRNKKKQEKYIE